MSKCTWCTRDTQETCPECWGTGEKQSDPTPSTPIDKENELRRALESQIRVAYTWGMSAGQLKNDNDIREARALSDGNIWNVVWMSLCSSLTLISALF